MMITYSPGNSFLYCLNPFLKGFFTMLTIIIFSALAANIWHLTISLALLLFFAVAGKVPLLSVLGSVKKIWFLLLIVALIQGFSRGDFCFILAIEAVFRIIGVFIAAGVFVTISSQSELMYFWEQSFRPFQLVGLPARELALVMVIAVRFLPVILGEIDRIRVAQMARGAKFSHGFGLKAIKSLMPLLVPTLSLAIIRAGDLALAMEARGYCVSRERTRFRQFRIGFFDILGILSFSGSLAYFFFNR
jgi:energy-coupling factor transport system permease protein